MPRKPRVLSLNAPAFRSEGERSPPLYATVADPRVSPLDQALEVLDHNELPADLKRDRATIKACELAGIGIDDFRFLEERNEILRNRFRRFTCTRDVDSVTSGGRSRQAESKRRRSQRRMARLVIPLQAILSDNDRGFCKWFPTMVTTWKGGQVEQLVNLRPAIERRGQELIEQFERAGSALLLESRSQMQEALELSWDGSQAGEFSRFLELYNRLRVSAVYSPHETRDFLTAVRGKIGPEQFWLSRAVDRSLHLTGDVDSSRQWIDELNMHLDFESQVPNSSQATAAYIGVYYADCLSEAEWASITRPARLSSPWAPRTLSKVLNESYQNTLEAWYQTPEQNTVNLLRVALYLRCHPDRGKLDSRCRRVVEMIIGQSRKRALVRESGKSLRFLQSLVS